jgi:hypothetical protein
LYQKSTDGAWSEVDVIRDGTGSPYDALGFSVAVSSIDGLSDYWVVSGAPQNLANGTGELRATGNIASLIDTDSDATKNDSDTDHDNNAVLNVNNRFPHDPAAFSDLDNDGFSDGDGLSDLKEVSFLGTGTDPLNPDSDSDGAIDSVDTRPLSRSGDTDGDGLVNDADNDGVFDTVDAFPLNSSETVETNGDGVGNNTDTNDDNSALDANDLFPLDASETIDTDTDGDGAIDTDISIQTPTTDIIVDLFPLNPNESSDSDGDCTEFNLITSGNGCGDNSVTSDTDDDGDGTLDAHDSTPTGAVTNGGGSSGPVFILMLLLANIFRQKA